MRVRVLFFASLRERAGKGQIDVEMPEGATVGALWERMSAAPPLGGHGARPGFAVNQEWCEPQRPLRDGDEVAFLPPVSGG